MHEKSYDLGRSINREGMSSPFLDEEKPTPIYPSLALSSREFPPVKDWEVGEKYELTIMVKMTGLHEHGKQQYGEFDVLSARDDARAD